MKKILFTLLAIAFCCTANAQFMGGFGQQGPSIKGKISGQLVDSLTQKPVEFATIVLINARTKKEVDGVISDEKGEFKLTEVKLGTYEIVASFLGYENKTIAEVKLDKKKPDANLDKVFMVSESLKLDEVVVTEEASLIENKIDKIVYNAEKDVANRGGDATDVLRRVPLLTVDLEGNVSLRGSQNLRILINGRPSGMFANNVADALKTIPADQIKSVEVITSPSAKYDGEGTAGIINIITKKKSVEGFTGSVNASIGNVQNNTVLNLSAAKGRFGINGNGSVYYSWPRDSRSTYFREDFFTGERNTTEQIGAGTSQYLGFNGSVNAFYDINAYHSLTSTFRLNGRRLSGDGLQNVIDNGFDELRRLSSTTNYDNSGLYSGYDWSTDYRIEFEENKEQELVFAFQISGNIDDRENNVAQDAGDAIDFAALNDGRNRETTFQVDYVQPFNPNLKLEIGAKSVLRRIESDYSRFDNVTQSIDNDPYRTNLFNYDQDVYAGYASFNIKFGKKYGLVAGARYEHTDFGGDYGTRVLDVNESAKRLAPFNESYSNILPSITLSRSYNFKTIKASYTRRIQRPSLFYINPFSDANDTRNVSFGNPLLNPELVSQYEVSYGAFIKGVVVNIGLFQRQTTDIIERFVIGVTDNVSESSYRNIGENNSVGVNLFSSATIKKVFTIRAGGNVYTYNPQGTINGINLDDVRGIQLDGFLSSSFAFKNGFKLEAFGFYKAPQLTTQGEIPSFSIFSVGAQKEILKKKGTIGVRVVEPFSKWKGFGTSQSNPQFTLDANYEVLFRSFGLNFSYRFGQLDFKQRERKSKIRNSDLKQGEGGGQGGGQGGGFNN